MSKFNLMNSTLHHPTIRRTLRTKKPPQRMTLIVGIKCKSAVIMACDSQITTDNIKQTDGAKLRVVEFQNFPCLVLQAGSVVHGAYFADVFEEMASMACPRTPREVGSIAQSAMLAVRKHLKAVHADGDLDEKLMSLGTNSEILIGFWMSGNPHIISISLYASVYLVVNRQFESKGSGGLLGDHLLREYITPDISPRMTRRLAVLIVDKVKQYDAFCSGITIVAAIQAPSGLGGTKGKPTVYMPTAKEVEEFSEEVKEADKSARNARNRILQSKIQEEDAELNRLINELVGQLPEPSAKDWEEMYSDHPDVPEADEAES